MIKNVAANLIYGRDFPTDGTCVCHGKPVTESDFRSEVAKKEYLISRLCQQTQDTVFGTNSNDDEGDC
jgi:hypothetical protein